MAKKVDKPPAMLPSLTGQTMLNYSVYYMKSSEKILNFLFAFLVGAAVGLLFYGGIGKDQFGNRTTLTWICDISVVVIVGSVSAKLFLPMRVKQIIIKRQKDLTLQFRELMSSLSASFGTGKNVLESFQTAYNDLEAQYPKNSYIMIELDNILQGLNNNINIEPLLVDFGARSTVEDIRDFGSIFEICYRRGGNLKEVVRNSCDLISEKMTILDEIDTKVASNKTEATVMSVMPILVVAMIKFSNPSFAEGFVKPMGLIATTISIGVFIGAYFLSNKILRIEV